MKIIDFQAFQFELPLKQKLYINNQNIITRQGIIVRVADNFGNNGYGEVSPLPGLHHENISQSIKELKNVKDIIIQKSFADNIEQVICEIFKNIEMSPSVRFGLETAIYGLYAKKQNVAIPLLFNKNPHYEININGLLTGSEIEIINRAKSQIAKGYTTLKLKVGRKALDDEIKLVKTLFKIIKNKAILRLDANRKWSLQEAAYFFKSIEKENIEYVEEPLADPSGLEEFYIQTEYPIALDESLTDIDPLKYIPPNWCKAFILKPTVIGSIQKTLQFIRVAEKQNILPVISDTFQSGVGLAMLAAISASIQNNQLAMGFDTYNYLKNDILVNPLGFNKNKLSITRTLDYANKINYTKLDPILIT